MKRTLQNFIGLLFVSLAFLTSNAQNLVHSYTFDNTKSNEAGTATFGTGGNFTNDRFGNAQSAFNASGFQISTNGTVPATGNGARSIAFWIRLDGANSGGLSVYMYGAQNNNQAFGMTIYGAPANFIRIFGWANDFDVTQSLQLSTWYHFVVTHDGTTCRLYLDGQLIGQSAKTYNTSGGTFQISNHVFDDLRMYNYALSPAEVNYLYTNQPGQVTYYPFNNSFNNQSGNEPFSEPAVTQWVSDRNGNANSAIRFTNVSSPSAANISNLPFGSLQRSVSFWFRTSAVNSGIFRYGTNNSLATFGLYTNSSGNFLLQRFGNDHNFGGTCVANTWYHVVLTYKNGVARMYLNGTQLGSATSSVIINTGVSNFLLGGNGAEMEFDDLRIFNYEINAAEANSLFLNNTLSNQEFVTNQKKSTLYPNPSNNWIYVESETAIQQLELYNLNGQLIKKSNHKQVLVSDLPKGIYLLRIIDQNNYIQTEKVIVE
ncbi:MAG: T9SS type A sorting domain-containing protein [Flavobacteriales bacterium]|nr:T9SS type A sorting domain-containing protein [Flavobacteriales bacterium]